MAWCKVDRFLSGDEEKIAKTLAWLERNGHVKRIDGEIYLDEEGQKYLQMVAAYTCKEVKALPA